MPSPKETRKKALKEAPALVTHETPTLYNIPKDHLYEILSYLGFEDINAFSQTCKFFHEQIHSLVPQMLSLDADFNLRFAKGIEDYFREKDTVMLDDAMTMIRDLNTQLSKRKSHYTLVGNCPTGLVLLIPGLVMLGFCIGMFIWLDSQSKQKDPLVPVHNSTKLCEDEGFPKNTTDCEVRRGPYFIANLTINTTLPGIALCLIGFAFRLIYKRETFPLRIKNRVSHSEFQDLLNQINIIVDKIDKLTKSQREENPRLIDNDYIKSAKKITEIIKVIDKPKISKILLQHGLNKISLELIDIKSYLAYNKPLTLFSLKNKKETTTISVKDSAVQQINSRN